MAVFPIDDHLLGVHILLVVFFLNTTLNAQNHRTSGIDDLNIVPSSSFIGFRRFAMCSEQYLGIMKMIELLMVDSDES